jgi:hypothetical protein
LQRLSKAKLVINTRKIKLLATEKKLTATSAQRFAVPPSKKLVNQAGATN